MNCNGKSLTLIAVVAALAVTGCRAPDSAKITNFVNTGLGSPEDSSSAHSWRTSSASDVDFTSSQGDANSGTNDVGTVQLGTPAALAVRGNSDFVMAFSNYDTSYATATAQSVFSAVPTVTGNTFSWPSAMGSYFYGSPVTDDYSGFPVLAQEWGGAGALLFLSSNSLTAAADYTLHAWVRESGSNTWLGHGGINAVNSSTTTPATLTTATLVNRRHHTICPVTLSPDYAGGFVAAWCGADTGNNAFPYFSHYSPHSGWSSATAIVERVASDGLDYSPVLTNGALTYNDDEIPPVGTGIALGFAPGGTGLGWAAWVLSRNAAGFDSYNIKLRLFNPARRDFIGTDMSNAATSPEAVLADSAAGEVIWSPLLFVESDGDFTLFYVLGTAGSGTASLMYYYKEYVAPSNATLTDDALTGGSAVGIPTVFDAISLSGSRAGDYLPPKLVRSPDGTRGLLAYTSDDDELELYTTTGSGTFTNANTITVPSALFVGSEIRDFDIAINDSGEILLTIGWIFGGTEVVYYGYSYTAADGWSSATALLVDGLYSCDPATAKSKVVLDNATTGAISITCLPHTFPGGGAATTETRQTIIPFK